MYQREPNGCCLRPPGGAVLAILVLLLAGCSIKTDGLVPDPPVGVETRLESSVRVMPVAGGRASSFGREAYITNEQYREALFRSLDDAGLFSLVTMTDAADLDLYSEIITITTEGGLSPRYAIVVQYWLVDPVSGDEIWRKGINTRHEVKWNEAFAGATRIIRAVEGATKKNLSQLVTALARAGLR